MWIQLGILILICLLAFKAIMQELEILKIEETLEILIEEKDKENK